jgi:phytoene desaturase
MQSRTQNSNSGNPGKNFSLAKRPKVVVIGAGLGGMAAAARLATAGYEVMVFDQNKAPGGKANQMVLNTEKGSFRFDTGPSLMTMKDIFEQLFIDCGEDMGKFLKLYPLQVLARYFWSDGLVLDYFAETERTDMIMDQVGLASLDEIRDYRNYSERIWDLTKDHFVYNEFNFKTFFKPSFWLSVLNIRGVDPFRSMHKANSSFFEDQRAVQLFDRYATYNGSNPYNAPATFNLINHVEKQGAFLPFGGIFAISHAIYQLCVKKGVRFYFGSKVQQILTTSDEQVFGVVVNDQMIQTNVVLSNCDPVTTYQELMAKETPKKKKFLDKKLLEEPSSSAIVYYWAMKGSYPQLDVHNVLFCNDYEKEFNTIFNTGNLPSEPTIYINVTSKLNRRDAPEGCENWFVMVNVPSNPEINWKVLSRTYKTIVLSKIEKALRVSALASNILSEQTLTPEDIEKNTGSYLGSLYGSSSNTLKSAFNRTKSKSKEFKGLYFAGGAVNPGGGMPMVLVSGKMASEAIVRDYKIE